MPWWRGRWRWRRSSSGWRDARRTDRRRRTGRRAGSAPSIIQIEAARAPAAPASIRAQRNRSGTAPPTRQKALAKVRHRHGARRRARCPLRSRRGRGPARQQTPPRGPATREERMSTSNRSDRRGAQFLWQGARPGHYHSSMLDTPSHDTNAPTPASSADMMSIVERSQVEAFEILGGDAAGGLMLLCDHASNPVPAEYGDLGLPAAEFERHIAYDIGAAAVTRGLAERFGVPAVLSRFSRLLIDPNRGARRSDADHAPFGRRRRSRQCPGRRWRKARGGSSASTSPMTGNRQVDRCRRGDWPYSGHPVRP